MYEGSNATLADSARAFPPPVIVPGLNDPWANCVRALRDYDEHMVKGWKEDIDSLLVFVSCTVVVTGTSSTLTRRVI